MLRDLARTRDRAHIATKLARHFVARRAAAGAASSASRDVVPRRRGDLARALPRADRVAGGVASARAKFKTPHDFVISTLPRARLQRPDNRSRSLAFLDQLGQRPYTPGSPAGWPDTAAHWDGGAALLKRIEWADAVGQRVGDRVDPRDARRRRARRHAQRRTRVRRSRARRAGARRSRCCSRAPSSRGDDDASTRIARVLARSGATLRRSRRSRVLAARARAITRPTRASCS